MRFIVVFCLLLIGTISIDVSSTATLTNEIVTDEVTVESNGVLVLIRTIQLTIPSLTVRSLGDFFFLTDWVTSIDVGTLDNNGYILFDIHQVTGVYIGFHNNNKNSGELIVYGKNLELGMYQVVNTGSMTFWGESGGLVLQEISNTGSICFHSQYVSYHNAAGAGCFYLAQSTVLVYDASADFKPTIVFDGMYNEFIVYNTQVLNFKLINFGVGDLVSVPNQGYVFFNYFSGSGLLVVYIAIYEINFNIGSGYDQSKFVVTSDFQSVHIRYSDSPPAGANQGGCTCSLNIRTPPVVTIESSSSEKSTVIESTTDVSTTISSTNRPSSTKVHSTASCSTKGNHDNGHGNGNGNDHGNNHDDENEHGHGNDHNDHGNDHDDHGKNKNVHGKDQNDHGNGNSNGNSNGSSNGKGNDKDKGKGNDKANDKGNNNGKGNNGNSGKGHKREIILANSAYSTEINSMLIIILSWIAW